MQQSSQSIQSNKISKPLSKDDSERLARSQIDRKQGYKEEVNNSIKGNGVDRRLTQTNNTAPRPIKEEINQLAKAWCELLLGQVMEARNQRN